MNASEGADVCEWVDDRWTKGWPPEAQVAYFHDLRDFDPSDVWAAVMHLYEQGTDFAPTGSKLLATCIVERRATARPDRQALPVPEPEPVFQSDYAQRRFGESMTGMELVARIHAEKPCQQTDCDMHQEAS